MTAWPGNWIVAEVCGDVPHASLSFEVSRQAENYAGLIAIVPYGVTSSQTDPLRDGTVLLLGLGQLLLRTESLVALRCDVLSACDHLVCWHTQSGFHVPHRDHLKLSD